MTDSVTNGLLIYIGCYLVGWIYLSGGIFEFFICHHKLSSVDSLKLFNIFGKIHRKVLASFYFRLEWTNQQDEKLMQEFREASQAAGIIWIILSSMFISLMVSGIVGWFVSTSSFSEQLNYGFWLLLILLTVAWFMRSAFKLIRVHRTLQSSRHDNHTQIVID